MKTICNIERWKWLAILFSLTLLLSACGTPPQRNTSMMKQDNYDRFDPTNIRDAVPRWEPASRYGNPVSYEVMGQRYYVRESSKGYVRQGIASWYGPTFHGKLTSTREVYNMYEVSAAHKELPIPCYARVTNLNNGKSVIVRVNDRGPFVDNREIDLSYAAALKIGVVKPGTARVEVKALEPVVSLADRRNKSRMAQATQSQKDIGTP